MEKTQTISDDRLAKAADLFEILQSSRFEGLISQAVAKAPAAVKTRLRNAGFYLPTGLWSGEKLAREYRNVILKKSSCGATVRILVQQAGDIALALVYKERDAKKTE